MDGSVLWSLDLVRAVQGLGGWLHGPMQVITFFGDETWFLLFVTLIFWCVNKPLGVDLGVLLVAAGGGNTFLKSLFKQPRPLWLDPTLGDDPIRSFSLPSGHAQTNTVLYGTLALRAVHTGLPAVGRGLAVIGLVVLTLLVSLSRIILGVHFPGDVLLGILAGLLTLIVYRALRRPLGRWFAARTIRQHVLMALPTAALLMGINLLVLFGVPVGGWPKVASSDTGMLAAHYAEGLHTSMDEAATLSGLVIGLWIGLALETRYVRFAVTGPLWQRVLRYLGGCAGIIAVWLGLRMVLPAEPIALGLALRTVCFGLIMFWAIYLWPALFVRIGLGSRTVDSPANA